MARTLSFNANELNVLMKRCMHPRILIYRPYGENLQWDKLFNKYTITVSTDLPADPNESWSKDQEMKVFTEMLKEAVPYDSCRQAVTINKPDSAFVQAMVEYTEKKGGLEKFRKPDSKSRLFTDTLKLIVLIDDPGVRGRDRQIMTEAAAESLKKYLETVNLTPEKFNYKAMIEDKRHRESKEYKSARDRYVVNRRYITDLDESTRAAIKHKIGDKFTDDDLDKISIETVIDMEDFPDKAVEDCAIAADAAGKIIKKATTPRKKFTIGLMPSFAKQIKKKILGDKRCEDVNKYRIDDILKGIQLSVDDVDLPANISDPEAFMSHVYEAITNLNEVLEERNNTIADLKDEISDLKEQVQSLEDSINDICEENDLDPDAYM